MRSDDVSLMLTPQSDCVCPSGRQRYAPGEALFPIPLFVVFP